MDFIDPILSVATEIYRLVDRVKANKERCHRISERVKPLDDLVRSIKESEAVRNCVKVKNALEALSCTLNSAKKLIEKYASENLLERILNSNSHGEEFNNVNDRLDDAFKMLCAAQQVEHGNILYKVFEQTSRAKQDEHDGKEDDKELQKLLLEYLKKQVEQLEHVQFNMEKIVEILNKPKVTNVDIRMIRPDELEYELPKEPFMTTPTSEVYKGVYRGFTVAIKRYTEPMNTSPGKIKSIFNKEVDTMKRFESPNILRMYGICVRDENGPNPEFLIVMEYCEKGSLRQLLASDCKLSWIKKARMCLDAAEGLYRLHQTEEKSKVHGCINSCKFLVAEGYRVKLGGFELSKTETSLKKSMTNPTKDEDVRSLCYSSPQMLKDINYVYNKECEMYSFGIVLWEIATRKIPFEGYSDQDILQKVGHENYQQPLPKDCPKALVQLINACRHNDSFQRPSARVLADKLGSLVTQMEEKKETQI